MLLCKFFLFCELCVLGWMVLVSWWWLSFLSEKSFRKRVRFGSIWMCVWCMLFSMCFIILSSIWIRCWMSIFVGVISMVMIRKFWLRIRWRLRMKSASVVSSWLWLILEMMRRVIWLSLRWLLKNLLVVVSKWRRSMSMKCNLLVVIIIWIVICKRLSSRSGVLKSIWKLWMKRLLFVWVLCIFC